MLCQDSALHKIFALQIFVFDYFRCVTEYVLILCVMLFLFRQTHPFTPPRASLLHSRNFFSMLRWQIKQGLPLYSQKADKKADRKGQKEDGKWLFYQHTISVIHHLTCTCWLFYQHSLSHLPSDMHLLVILPIQSQSSTI